MPGYPESTKEGYKPLNEKEVFEGANNKSEYLPLTPIKTKSDMFCRWGTFMRKYFINPDLYAAQNLWI